MKLIGSTNKHLERWQILKVVAAPSLDQVGHYHFAGFNTVRGNLVISSRIGWFDRAWNQGLTESGSFYKLAGDPAIGGELLDAVRAQLTKMYVDATEEFLRFEKARIG